MKCWIMVFVVHCGHLVDVVQGVVFYRSQDYISHSNMASLLCEFSCGNLNVKTVQTFFDKCDKRKVFPLYGFDGGWSDELSG